MAIDNHGRSLVRYLNRLEEIGFFLSPKTIKEARDRVVDYALSNIQPWDPTMRWDAVLGLDAKDFMSWIKPFLLEPELGAGKPGKIGEEPRIDIPGTDYYYCHCSLPARYPLTLVKGRHVGRVVFNGVIYIPVLRKYKSYDEERKGPGTVWMSLSPQEVLTNELGIRRGKGHTVIAGLGLGYMLLRVAQRKKVKRITLVEIDQALHDWIWPRVRPMLNGEHTKVETVIGDAYDVVPKLTADSALIDIYRSYGGNEFPTCPDIGQQWVWGSNLL